MPRFFGWSDSTGRNRQHKISCSYTLEELYEKIKNVNFAAGKPSTKFTIQRAEALGLKGFLVNDALDMLTGGLFRVSGMVGDNTKRCEELVDETYNQLEALGL